MNDSQTKQLFKTVVAMMEKNSDNKDPGGIINMAKATSEILRLEQTEAEHLLALHWEELVSCADRMAHMTVHIRGAMVHQLCELLRVVERKPS